MVLYWNKCVSQEVESRKYKTGHHTFTRTPCILCVSHTPIHSATHTNIVILSQSAVSRMRAWLVEGSLCWPEISSLRQQEVILLVAPIRLKGYVANPPPRILVHQLSLTITSSLEANRLISDLWPVPPPARCLLVPRSSISIKSPDGWEDLSCCFSLPSLGCLTIEYIQSTHKVHKVYA